MPIFPSTLPTCAACGAFLAPTEQEANLRITSTLIATCWTLPIRLLCLRCVADDPQDEPEADEVYKNFKRYFAAARTTRRIPLVSFFSPTKHFACILYICAV